MEIYSVACRAGERSYALERKALVAYVKIVPENAQKTYFRVYYLAIIERKFYFYQL